MISYIVITQVLVRPCTVFASMPRTVAMSVCVCLLLLVASTVLAREEPRVTVQHGQLEGRYEASASGRQYASFRGVPYAAPPVGERRFLPPDALEPWTDVLLAKKDAPNCLQYEFYRTVRGEEDCLYVNVFTPSLPEEGSHPSRHLLDVIVFIHGGAFMYGGNTSPKPDYLMDSEVVLVTVNYRLGVLGFLSAGDSVLPGNNGLKDQVAALKWVRDNIAAFGGNPASVTLAGLSAGGASVHFHYLSPMSKGLFHRGISLSGSALCQWALADALPEKTQQLAHSLGCPGRPTRDLLTCLRNTSGHALVELASRFQPWMYNPFTPIGPTVEPASPDAFLPRHPRDALLAGHVETDAPWLTGVTSEEGLYPAAEFVNNDAVLADLEERWDTLLPHLLDYNYTVPIAAHSSVAALIREHYLRGQAASRDSVSEIVQMIGDRHFVVGVEEAARLQAAATDSPVYMYHFFYRGHHSFSELLSNSKNNYGSCHGDDLAYILRSPFSESNTTPADLHMCRLLQGMWTSFVHAGKPLIGLEWPPVAPSTDVMKYVKIDVDGSVAVLHTHDLGHRRFWTTLPFYDVATPKKAKEEL